MFKRQIRDLDHEVIGSQAVGLDDDRAAFAFRRVEQRPELLERDFLIAKINRRAQHLR